MRSFARLLAAPVEAVRHATAPGLLEVEAHDIGRLRPDRKMHQINPRLLFVADPRPVRGIADEDAVRLQPVEKPIAIGEGRAASWLRRE